MSWLLIARIGGRARYVLALSVLCVLLAADDSSGDKVVILNAFSIDDPVVVYRGWVGGHCLTTDPLIVAGAASVDVGDAEARGECPQEILVFSQLHGAYANREPLWLPSGSDQKTFVELPPLERIPVSIWVVKSATWDVTVPSRLSYAVWHGLIELLLKRSGLLLDVRVNLVNAGTARANYIGTGCQAAQAMRRSFDPLDNPYIPQAMNVFVVDQILEPGGIWDPTSALGWACADHDAPNVAYLSYDFNQATLAHELGHLLGFVAPEIVHPTTVDMPTFGHSNLLRCQPVTGPLCFDAGNVMNSNVLAIDQITLGQSYRMNFDAKSWLNRSEIAMLRPMVRTCQSDHWWWAPCPRLNMEAP